MTLSISQGCLLTRWVPEAIELWRLTGGPIRCRQRLGGMLKYYLSLGSLREDQANSDGVIIIRCVGSLPSAAHGPFLGWLQPIVPSSEEWTWEELPRSDSVPAETCPRAGIAGPMELPFI